MKQIIIITILLLSIVSCKKKEIKPIDNSPKWYGIYHSDNLFNDSTLITIPNTFISINTDLATNNYHKDSIRFNPIITQYGKTYIYNVDYIDSINYQKGYIQGINGTMNDYNWIDKNGIAHELREMKIILIDKETIKVEYSEIVLEIPTKKYHYVGTYKK